LLLANEAALSTTMRMLVMFEAKAPNESSSRSVRLMVLPDLTKAATGKVCKRKVSDILIPLRGLVALCPDRPKTGGTTPGRGMAVD
jgi:hypothetical protein